MKIKHVLVSFLSLLVYFSVYGEINEPLRGNSYTDFGEYEIVLSDEPMMVGDRELVTYDLNYKNLNDLVKIGIDQKKNCQKFIVKHPSFEIEYICTRNGFGVCAMEDQYATLNKKVISYLLDGDQFNCQILILPEKRPTDELLHLIAGYFPQLISKEVRNIVNKT